MRALLAEARALAETLPRVETERARRDPGAAWRHGLLVALERLGPATTDDLAERAASPRRVVRALLAELRRDRAVEVDESPLPPRERAVRLTAAGRAEFAHRGRDEAARLTPSLRLSGAAAEHAITALRHLREVMSGRGTAGET